MDKVHINTEECEEIARLLTEKSTSLSAIASGVQKTLHQILGWSCNRTPTSWSTIDRASKMAKSASDCIYQSVKIYNSAEKNVSGFENWLVDEELRRLREMQNMQLNTINDFVDQLESAYDQSAYRVLMDAYGVIGRGLMSGWDYFVDWDAEDVAGAFGVDSEAEAVILRMCENEDASVIEQAYGSFISLLSESSGTVKDTVSFIDDEGIKNAVISFLNEHNVAAYNWDRMEDCLSIFNSAMAAGEKDVAYFMLLNTVKFKALQPVIEATGDKGLIDTYSRMQYNLDHGLEMTAKNFGSELAFDTAMRGLGFVPGLGEVLQAKDITVMGVDYVLGTSDIADSYSMMKKCRSISDSISITVNKTRNDFLSSPTEENFDKMINAIRAHAELEAVGNKYAYDLYSAADNAIIKNDVPAQLKQLLEECGEIDNNRLSRISELSSQKKRLIDFLQRNKP